MGSKAEINLKSLLAASGYSEKVADELWKWYDAPDKRGEAGFQK